jgi:4-amino-4-deoxy-L-arabinose transferase-like glycosyltransferase
MPLPAVREAQSKPLTGSSSYFLWATVALAAVVRLIALGRKSFWLDEIASVAIARRPSPVFWHFLWHEEGNMALYYVLLKPWLHLGYGEATVRLLSVVVGIACVPMMYALARRLLNERDALLAAALLALNSCAVSVSQEARAYAFVVLMVLLSTYLFVRLIETPTFSFAFAYGLAAGVTCYFHYFGVLVPAAHAVSVIALPPSRRPWRALMAGWALIVLLAAPVLWLIHSQDVVHISWVGRPSWLELYHFGVFLAADGGKGVGGALLVIELVLAGFFVAHWRKTKDQQARWRACLIASMLCTPVAITLLVSIIRPAFYHRFLIICLPGWLLMVTAGVANVPSSSWRRAAAVGVCLLSLVTTIMLYRHATEDWRGAARYLLANTRPEDRVLYYQPVGAFVGEEYREWIQPPNTARPIGVAVDPDNQWEGKLDHAPQVWVVLFRAKVGEEAPLAIARELNARYVEDGTASFHAITIVRYRAK